MYRTVPQQAYIVLRLTQGKMQLNVLDLSTFRVHRLFFLVATRALQISIKTQHAGA